MFYRTYSDSILGYHDLYGITRFLKVHDVNVSGLNIHGLTTTICITPYLLFAFCSGEVDLVLVLCKLGRE